MTSGTPHTRVAAIFENGKRPRPVWFDLNGRKYTVEKTNYFWTGRKGNSAQLHFAVDSEGGLYELTFDSVSQTWSVEQVTV